MKKHLIAAAVAGAFAVPAMAQVTISGNFDAGYVSAKTADGQTFRGIQSGATSTSKLIISASEDLGGGLRANIMANTTVVVDRAATFQRNINPNLGTGVAATSATNQGFPFGDRNLYVGLSGGFGEVRIGRNQSLSDGNLNTLIADGSVWTYFMANSAAQGGVNVNFGSAAPVLGAAGRISDSVVYRSPVINGFQVQALRGWGERDNLASEGAVTEASISYAAGPISVSYSMGEIAAAPNDASTFAALSASASQAALNAASAGSKSTENRLMASYNLGVARLAAGYYNQEVGTAAKDSAWHVTVAVPAGALTFGGTYMNVKDGSGTGADKDKDGYSLNVRYALSKRTYGYAFYRTMDKTSSHTSKPSAFYLGMNHAF